MVDLILFLINMLSTWRLWVCVSVGVAAAMFVPEGLRGGVVSVALSMMAIAVGSIIGWWWQVRYERRARR